MFKYLLIAVLLVAATQGRARTQFLLNNVPKSSRIVGGEVTTPGQIPFQVAIVLDGADICGGSLISNNVVLTAGICILGTTKIEIHLGAQNIYDLNEAGRVVVEPSGSVIPEQPTKNLIRYDFGILNLPSDVSGPNIAPIRLPSRSQVDDFYVGEIGRASGWGLTSDETTEISPELKFVDLKVMASADCELFWAPGTLYEGNFCVETTPDASICLGDNGGPLTLNESDGVPTLIGVASFGSSAGCQISYPKVFTRTANFLDWFEQYAGITIRP